MLTSYWPAVIVSLLLHAGVILLVTIGWQSKPEQKPYKPPSYIKATLIDIKAQGKVGAAEQKPKPKKIDLQKKQREQQRLKRLAEEKQRKKMEAKQKAERDKKAREKKLAEQRKLEQEALQKQAELERQQLEKQLFEESLLKEQERIEAERQAEAFAQQVEDDKLLAQSYSMLIRQRIEENWSRPPSARNNMEALLTIQLIPTGEVIDVVVSKSSGSRAFDRSAMQAVKKVRQFEELQEMPSRVFEKDFRKFKLLFKPQDLRQ